MEYNDVMTIALAVLTSIITGGFVLVFVEIGNRKNRENDRYDQIMSPFMHKLSSYFRFISWCSSYIIYQKPLNGYEEDFKKLVDKMARYGGRATVSGGDYGVEYFTADELYHIASDINNIWYYHDKMHPCRLTWDARMRGTEDFITKELKEINPVYLQANRDVDLVAKVSGEFYTDLYQYIEYDTFRHEAYQKQYRLQSIVVASFFGFVLLVLGLMTFLIIPLLLLQCLVLLAILMVLICIPLLAVDVKVQINWMNKMREYMEKNKLNKDKLGKWWKTMKKTFRAVLDFILSKMVIVGLLMAVWAIFSIEIAWIPRIPTNLSEHVAAGWNRVFLALAYSYIAGVILYAFTVTFPSYLQQRKFRPVIKSKIKSIGTQLHNMLIPFSSVNNPVYLEETDSIAEMMKSKDWNSVTNIPLYPTNYTFLRAFHFDCENLHKEIDQIIADYKHLMDAESVLLLEAMRTDAVFDLLEVGIRAGGNISEYVRQAIADQFPRVVKNYLRLVDKYGIDGEMWHRRPTEAIS